MIQIADVNIGLFTFKYFINEIVILANKIMNFKVQLNCLPFANDSFFSEFIALNYDYEV